MSHNRLTSCIWTLLRRRRRRNYLGKSFYKLTMTVFRFYMIGFVFYHKNFFSVLSDRVSFFPLNVPTPVAGPRVVELYSRLYNENNSENKRNKHPTQKYPERRTVSSTRSSCRNTVGHRRSLRVPSDHWLGRLSIVTYSPNETRLFTWVKYCSPTLSRLIITGRGDLIVLTTSLPCNNGFFYHR